MNLCELRVCIASRSPCLHRRPRSMPASHARVPCSIAPRSMKESALSIAHSFGAGSPVPHPRVLSSCRPPGLRRSSRSLGPSVGPAHTRRGYRVAPWGMGVVVFGGVESPVAAYAPLDSREVRPARPCASLVTRDSRAFTCDALAATHGTWADGRDARTARTGAPSERSHASTRRARRAGGQPRCGRRQARGVSRQSLRACCRRRCPGRRELRVTSRSAMA